MSLWPYNKLRESSGSGDSIEEEQGSDELEVVMTIRGDSSH